MKRFKVLTQSFANLILKMGALSFSILSSLLLITIVTAIEVIIVFILDETLNDFNLLRISLFVSLIGVAFYFLSIVVKKIERSRQNLSRLIDKFEIMRSRYSNIYQKLNKEITEQKKTELRLRQKSELCFNASPDLIYYCNENSELAACNKAIEILTGKSEKELIGLQPKDLYSPEIAKQIKDTDKQVIKNKRSLTYEQWLHYPDGHQACFAVHKVPFHDQVGIKNGLIGFGRDITVYKNHQNTLKKINKDKNTFVATISHELLTSLGGIAGLAHILLDEELNPDRTQYLKMIYMNAVTSINIFNDIVDINKIERAAVNINYQEIDLGDFLFELKNISTLLVHSKGLRFRMVLQPALPKTVLIDGTRLRQILWNLIGNAVKFSDQDDVIVEVFYEPEDRLVFAVKDSGIGIPIEEQSRIFNLYYQIKDPDGKTAPKGSGIGLSVSQQLAKKMGGDITVKSAQGQGSCFTLYVKAPVCSEKIPSLNHDDNVDLPLLHVLLAEDLEININIARSVFEKLGITFEVAVNGSEALSLFGTERFDFVLLDIQLPDMTGFDIAQQIRDRHDRKLLPPLIAFTANILKNRKEYLEKGMDDVLTKPLSENSLIQIIKKYFPDFASSHFDETNEYKNVDETESILNLTLLKQYIELLGLPIIKKNVALFEETLPHYLGTLNQHAKAKNKSSILEEAHKIESASSAVGLCRLQQCAHNIQTVSESDKIREYINELKYHWKSDIKVLREWLKNNETTC